MDPMKCLARVRKAVEAEHEQKLADKVNELEKYYKEREEKLLLKIKALTSEKEDILQDEKELKRYYEEREEKFLVEIRSLRSKKDPALQDEETQEPPNNTSSKLVDNIKDLISAESPDIEEDTDVKKLSKKVDLMEKTNLELFRHMALIMEKLTNK